MKNRMTALLLVLAMALVLGAGAASAEGTEPAEETGAETMAEAVDAETAETLTESETAEAEGEEMPDGEGPARAASGTVSFTELGSVMRAHYYPLLSLEENIAALKAANGDTDTLRQMEDAENQMLMGGETLYITLVGLEAQDAALSRTLAALDRTAKEMELRHELGQISELQLAQVKNGRTQAISGQQTLRMNIDLVRMQLKAMAGVALDGALTLSALPTVTAERLSAMNLDADLVRAKAASYALEQAKKTRDEAEANAAAAAAYGMPGAQNSIDAARYTYENAALTFELNFRTLYAQVKDCAQVLSAARAALAAEEQSYAASALKYEQGNLSANALADAKDKLAEAKDGVSSAQRDLFSKYRSYEWAVEYGILNG